MYRLGRFVCRFSAAALSIDDQQELQIVLPTNGLWGFLPEFG